MNAVEEKERGRKKRKGERVCYQRIWKTNFPMEAKTQKERIEGGGGQKASTERLKFAGENDGKCLLCCSVVVQWCL